MKKYINNHYFFYHFINFFEKSIESKQRLSYKNSQNRIKKIMIYNM